MRNPLNPLAGRLDGLPDLQASWQSWCLTFRRPARTSRGVMDHRPLWFLRVSQADDATLFGLGEVPPLAGLSVESPEQIPPQLDLFCQRLASHGPREALDALSLSSVRFGAEMALLDLLGGGERTLFPSAFTRGEQAITINGLIWMGSVATMLVAVEEKLGQGFRCIKLKIGAEDFDQECAMIQAIRQRFSKEEVEIRLDANGAFAPDEAEEKLARLAPFGIHSIEQPLPPGHYPAMAHLCAASPIAIALDEELIGVDDQPRRLALLAQIKPHYLILKPALIGGFSGAGGWMDLANRHGIGWWITSALESNVGLNALAQWSATLQNPRPQGLGTGGLFVDNFPSPLVQQGETLAVVPDRYWDLSALFAEGG
ncbi:MAG: o-succinylbenzoate synthase [Magnetococcales bacterium]|nr:o-succinylbenzoate synthase [Magnetococcales bacterium]